MTAFSYFFVFFCFSFWYAVIPFMFQVTAIAFVFTITHMPSVVLLFAKSIDYGQEYNLEMRVACELLHNKVFIEL